ALGGARLRLADGAVGVGRPDVGHALPQVHVVPSQGGGFTRAGAMPTQEEDVGVKGGMLFPDELGRRSASGMSAPASASTRDVASIVALQGGPLRLLPRNPLREVREPFCSSSAPIGRSCRAASRSCRPAEDFYSLRETETF